MMAQPANLGEHLLHARLPPAPAEVLLLGECSAPWGAALAAQGYRTTVLRWRQQENQVLPPAGANGELVQVQLIRPPEGDLFDAVVALDFAPDIHPLALFDELDRVLAPTGVVLLAGKVCPAPWLTYVAAIGGRSGFVPGALLEDAASSRFVQVFHRAETAPRWRVGHVLPRDVAEVGELFREVFGHPLTRELWHWKYGEGRGNAVMARNAGKVVAHYGGIYRDVLVSGKLDRVAQICDVMVQSRERGVLTRQGPFFLLGASWPEIYGPKGFGFPTERHVRLAEKMGLYVEAGRLAEVRWTPSARRVRFTTRARFIDLHSNADRDQVNRLWVEMAHDLHDGVIGLRDWDFLVHRYARHPHNRYEVVAVSGRFSGKLLGIAVLRRLEDSCELLDVIAPLRNLPHVIDQSRRLAGHWRLSYLYCWITRNFLPLFLATGGEEHVLDISIPASSWTLEPQYELFVDRWWLMAGDTDFR